MISNNFILMFTGITAVATTVYAVISIFNQKKDFLNKCEGDIKDINNFLKDFESFRDIFGKGLHYDSLHNFKFPDNNFRQLLIELEKRTVIRVMFYRKLYGSLKSLYSFWEHNKREIKNGNYLYTKYSSSLWREYFEDEWEDLEPKLERMIIETKKLLLGKVKHELEEIKKEPRIWCKVYNGVDKQYPLSCLLLTASLDVIFKLPIVLQHAGGQYAFELKGELKKRIKRKLKGIVQRDNKVKEVSRALDKMDNEVNDFKKFFEKDFKYW